MRTTAAELLVYEKLFAEEARKAEESAATSHNVRVGVGRELRPPTLSIQAFS
jgi:hypothetical protein